jgi:hypothetical protein
MLSQATPMLYLNRRQFPDRLLDGEALDAAADVWFGWYDDARHQAATERDGYHRVEARLWGFPRHEAGRLAEVLRRSTANAGSSSLRVECLDPDTLTVTTPYLALAQPCSLAEVFGCFVGPEFEGLLLMLRLSLHEWAGEPVGPPLAGGTLVICGQLEQGRLLLKGIWPVGLVPAHEDLYLKGKWAQEDNFLHALGMARATGRAGPPPERLFASRPTQMHLHWLLSRIVHFPGQPRLPAFLGRVGFFTALLLIAVALVLALPGWRNLRVLPVTALLLPLVPLYGLVYVVWKQARVVAQYYVNMSTNLKRAFSKGARFVPTDLAAVGAWPDPHAAKYSSEIEALGGRHYVDIHHEPRTSGTSYVRVFVLPEDHTYVHLLLLYATGEGAHVLFPARASLLLTTYFTSGERLTTANSDSGYRKRLNPRVIARYFENAEDPATMVAKHRKVLGRLLAEGRQLAPLMGPEELLRRLEEDHEEARRLMQRYGYYSWAAAVRQTFRLVRPEYREE